MKTMKFKPSEIGPIPEEWEVKRVGDFGPVVTGSTPSRRVQENWGGNFCWISAKDFKGKYIRETEEHITERGKQYCRVLPENSVLVTCIASIGLNAIAQINCATNQQINAVVCASDSPEYFYYQICHNCETMKQLAGQTAVPIIGKKQFENLLIPVPPRAEQEKIAAALSDVDELLAAMTALIEKKRAIKQGAMQELLEVRSEECGVRSAPRRRLAGFTGAWVEKRLGDCGEFVGGGTPSTTVSEYWGGDIDWYTPAEIGAAKYATSSERKITKEGLMNSAARLLPVGTILLTTRASIGLSAILRREAATNQGFQSLVVNEEFDCEFMFYFLSTIVREMECRASGSTFLEISSAKLKEIPVIVPPTLAEQKAIAGVLADMDAEIAALEAKRAKYEQIKQGMMQELLTGKTRLEA